MNSEGEGRQRIQAWVCVGVLPLLGALAWWRPLPVPPAPPRIPASAAEPWMADCLPGVGVKTREHLAAAVRERRLEALPRGSQEAARQLFDLER